MEVWLVIPPINLEQPPVYAHPNPILSHETKSLINNLVQKKQWTSILLLDQTHAKANYELGIKTQDKNKLIIAAQRDYATQRITPAFQDILLEICETNPKTVTCIDLRHIQEDNTSQFFHDFCHPTRTFGVDSIANSLLQHIE
jgi:hypothetical protein